MADDWEPKLPPADEPPPRSFPLGLTVAATIGFIVLLSLGLWQLQRLQWKERLLAHVGALQSAPARPLEPVLDVLSKGGDVDFTRVRATCPGLASAPFLQLYALRDGQAGWRLISSCEAASARYRTVLVDRGFIADAVAARPKVEAGLREPITLTGVLRKPDRAGPLAPRNEPAANHWFSRDVPAMARALGAAQPAPAILFAETSSNPDFRALTPAPLPTDIPNRHLEYALTWFGLAAALAGVYAAVLLRRRTT
jgi:surfeit locus 1 family protein